MRGREYLRCSKCTACVGMILLKFRINEGIVGGSASGKSRRAERSRRSVPVASSTRHLRATMAMAMAHGEPVHGGRDGEGAGLHRPRGPPRSSGRVAWRRGRAATDSVTVSRPRRAGTSQMIRAFASARVPVSGTRADAWQAELSGFPSRRKRSLPSDNVGTGNFSGRLARSVPKVLHQNSAPPPPPPEAPARPSPNRGNRSANVCPAEGPLPLPGRSRPRPPGGITTHTAEDEGLGISAVQGCPTSRGAKWLELGGGGGGGGGRVQGQIWGRSGRGRGGEGEHFFFLSSWFGCLVRRRLSRLRRSRAWPARAQRRTLP